MGRLVLLLLVACGRDPTPACEAVADRAAEALQLPGKPDPKLARAYRDVVLVRCLRDDWTAAARTCLGSVKTRADVRACRDKLSSSQARTMENDFAGITVEREPPDAGVKPTLPEDMPSVRPSPSLVIELLETAIRVDGRSVDDEELDRLLRAAYVRDKNTQVTLKAAAGVPHSKVVALMDRVKESGLAKLALESAP